MTLRNLRLPTFLSGMGSVLDIAGRVNDPRFDIAEDGFAADGAALASDWESVGGDLWSAAERARPAAK